MQREASGAVAGNVMGQLKQHASPKPGSGSLGGFKVIIIMHFHIIVTPHDHEVFITILHSYCIIIACYFSNNVSVITYYYNCHHIIITC